MTIHDSWTSSIERDGYSVVHGCASLAVVGKLTSELTQKLEAKGSAVRPHGIRNLADRAEGVRTLAGSATIRPGHQPCPA